MLGVKWGPHYTSLYQYQQAGGDEDEVEIHKTIDLWMFFFCPSSSCFIKLLCFGVRWGVQKHFQLSVFLDVSGCFWCLAQDSVMQKVDTQTLAPKFQGMRIPNKSLPSNMDDSYWGGFHPHGLNQNCNHLKSAGILDDSGVFMRW
jgi:hypothetical protein